MTSYKPLNENSPRSPLGRFESDIEMEKIYNDEDANLSQIADKLLEDMDDDFSNDNPSSSKGRKLLYAMLVTTVVGGFSTLAYYAYQFGRKPVDVSQLQLVKADNTPYKEKPADPGGMQVPNMDKTVYDSIAGNQEEKLPKVERILPPPEEPMRPSRAAYEPMKDEIAAGTKQAVTDTRNEAQAISKNEVIAPQVEAKAPAEVVRQVQESAPAPVAVKPVETASSGLKPVSEQDLRIVPEKVATPVSMPSKAAANSRYKIQLGAFRSETDAAREWNSLTKRFPGELKGLEYFVERKDLGTKGVFYRLQAGPFNNGSDARQVCKKLVENKQGCFFVDAQ